MDRLPAPPIGARYHRLGRTAATRWWSPVLGTVSLVVAVAVLMLLVLLIGYGVHDPLAESSTRLSASDQVWELGVLFGALAMGVPAALLVARRVDRRPAGSVSSVAGALRWRWLWRCTGVCVAGYGLYGALGVLVEPIVAQRGGPDWSLIAAVFAVGAVLGPLQAAGEEYVFRGYLPQAAGAFVQGPVIPAVVCSLLFGLVHGLAEGTWALVDRVGFGLIAAWLTIRTGGLEAAIALHSIGNLLGLTLVSADGELEQWLVGPGELATAPEALVDLAFLMAIALALARIARRSGIQTRWGAG